MSEPALKYIVGRADASTNLILAEVRPVGAPAAKPVIDTCNACGKLFPRHGIRLCTQCSLVEEHRFALVREYLNEHNGAAIPEIARGTGVSSSDVRKFMDSGRIVQMKVNVNGDCTCSGGERCRACRMRLAGTFREMESTMAREHAERDTAGPSRRLNVDDDDEHGRTKYVRRIRRINGD